MLTIWRITMRRLSYSTNNRDTHSKCFAIESQSEIIAVSFAKKNIHSPEWWDGYIITEIVQVGELWAAEGITVPMDEDS